MRITVGCEEVQRPVTLSSRSLESNQGSSRYTVYEERVYERRARALAARTRRRSSTSSSNVRDRIDLSRSEDLECRSAVGSEVRTKKKAAVVSQAACTFTRLRDYR